MKVNEKYTQRQLLILKRIRGSFPFIICFIIASIFWFTREMGKTYNETLTIPVKYEKIPNSVALVSKVPQTLSVDIEGSGWGILNYYVFGKDYAVVDVSLIETNNISHIRTNDTLILSNIGFGSELKVLNIFPQEIVFNFEKINAKRVPVKTNVSLTFEQQYELKDKMQINPDTITIYGSKSITDTISYVQTETYEPKKLKDDFSKNINIKKIANIRMSTESVVISGEVEKFTEQTILVPIRIMNFSKENMAIDLITEKVSVSFLIGMSKVQSYSVADFEAVADYQKRTQNGVIPIEIVRHPNFVRIIHQEPLYDGVIIDSIRHE